MEHGVNDAISYLKQFIHPGLTVKVQKPDSPSQNIGRKKSVWKNYLVIDIYPNFVLMQDENKLYETFQWSELVNSVIYNEKGRAVNAG